MIVFLLTACSPCKRGKACEVEDGTFYAVEPDSWDGSSKLPAVFMFHGWTGNPQQYTEDPEVLDVFEEFGWLLVAPEGIDATWQIDHMGLVGSGRSEVDFVKQVLGRVKDLWPIDESRVYLAGFSLGASLVYTLACEEGDTFAAASPMAGGFWDPMPMACDSPQIPICHIHGTADETWPLEGRTITQDGEEGLQVPIQDDVDFWLNHNDCDVSTSDEVSWDPLTCTYWSDCSGGSEVGYCLHDGEHERIPGWIGRELEWFDRFQR